MGNCWTTWPVSHKWSYSSSACELHRKISKLFKKITRLHFSLFPSRFQWACALDGLLPEIHDCGPHFLHLPPSFGVLLCILNASLHLDRPYFCYPSACGRFVRVLNLLLHISFSFPKCRQRCRVNQWFGFSFVTSLCCHSRVQKVAPMNNWFQAGICERINRHYIWNANNCSRLHGLIAWPSVYCAYWGWVRPRLLLENYRTPCHKKGELMGRN